MVRSKTITIVVRKRVEAKIIISKYPTILEVFRGRPFNVKFSLKNVGELGCYATGKVIDHRGYEYSDSVTLLPGEEKELSIHALKIDEEGTYRWLIRAYSDTFKLQDEKAFTVVVKKPEGIKIVEYPKEKTVGLEEAVVFDVKVRNNYEEMKTVRLELVDHEGEVRKKEFPISPDTTVLKEFYHPKIGKEGTYTWTLRAVNVTDGKLEDSVTIKIIVKKPEKPKYTVTVDWSGFSKPPYVKAYVQSDISRRRDFLPITINTEGWLRVSEIVLTTRRPATEGYVWQIEQKKWVYSKSSYPSPDTPVSLITFRRYSVNLSYKSKKVSDTVLTLTGVSSNGSVTLEFSVKRFGRREVKGEIIESNETVRFRWKCPVCGKVNENVEDKDRLEALGWKVAEMCKKCDVQSYVYLR